MVSHWLLDLLGHRPDLTLAGSPPMLGLGLWDQPMVAMPLEILVIGGALFFYLIKTQRTVGGGMLSLLVLVGLLAAWWLGKSRSVTSCP